MEKEEVLEKTKEKKALVGEFEKEKVNKGSMIALLITGIVAVALIITECAMGHYAGGLAIGMICYLWASLQYTFQFFLAHRPWQVLIGSVLHGLAFIACLVFFILFSVGVL